MICTISSERVLCGGEHMDNLERSHTHAPLRLCSIRQCKLRRGPERPFSWICDHVGPSLTAYKFDVEVARESSISRHHLSRSAQGTQCQRASHPLSAQMDTRSAEDRRARATTRRSRVVWCEKGGASADSRYKLWLEYNYSMQVDSRVCVMKTSKARLAEP